MSVGLSRAHFLRFALEDTYVEAGELKNSGSSWGADEDTVVGLDARGRMGRNQARRRGEVDHGRAARYRRVRFGSLRVAGIESPPLRVPADVIPLPHSIHTIILMGGWKFGENSGQMCGT